MRRQASTSSPGSSRAVRFGCSCRYRRLGIPVDLARLDELVRDTPVLVDLKPSGQWYMEDFHHAGGVPALLRELEPLLHLDAMTVTGRTLGEEIEAARGTGPVPVSGSFEPARHCTPSWSGSQGGSGEVVEGPGIF